MDVSKTVICHAAACSGHVPGKLLPYLHRSLAILVMFGCVLHYNKYERIFINCRMD